MNSQRLRTFYTALSSKYIWALYLIASVLGLWFLPQFVLSSGQLTFGPHSFPIPLIAGGILYLLHRKRQALFFVCVGLYSGWFVTTILAEQWLAPFPQIHWLRNLGIETGYSSLHLIGVYLFVSFAVMAPSNFRKLGLGIAFAMMAQYWFMPQQFLYENLKPPTGEGFNTTIFLDGVLQTYHWRREVFSDPPIYEFPSLAYNEYSLASIGHGMGLEMDPDNDLLRGLLYQVQLYGSIGVIYLRFGLLLLSAIFLLVSLLTRLQTRFVSVVRWSFSMAYLFPPLLNIVLCLLSVNFAESEQETARYLSINTVLFLASLGPFIVAYYPEPIKPPDNQQMDNKASES